MSQIIDTSAYILCNIYIFRRLQHDPQMKKWQQVIMLTGPKCLHVSSPSIRLSEPVEQLIHISNYLHK